MIYGDKTTTTIDGRKATPEAQLELRRRCIVYFRDGVKRAEIARRLGLSRQWVTKIIKIYQTEGFDSAVAGKKRGLNEAAASEKRRLSREEEKKVANWIVDKNPAQLKFDFALWTAKAVRQLIYREFGRQLDLSTVRRYLRSWGMTPQRPKRKRFSRMMLRSSAGLKQTTRLLLSVPKRKKPPFLGRRNRCPAGHQLDPRLRAARKDADDPS